MSEPTAGGPYQFAEPQQECRFVIPPRGEGPRNMTILDQRATWRGEVFFPRKKPDPEWIARTIVIARRWLDREAADHDQ